MIPTSEPTCYKVFEPPNCLPPTSLGAAVRKVETRIMVVQYDRTVLAPRP